MSRLTIIELQIAFYAILFLGRYNNSTAEGQAWK